MNRARNGEGPSFLRARVPRLDGHFLGDALVRAARSPAGDGRQLLGDVTSAALSRAGGGLGDRARSVVRLLNLMRRARRDERDTRRDPLERARSTVGEEVASRLEDEALAEVGRAVAAAGGAP